MREKFTILVADRNRNIREFLQRELTADGYRVILACEGRQVIKLIELEKPDLLLLDLDIPYAEELKFLTPIPNENLKIPIVIHTLPTDYLSFPPGIEKVAVLIEKDGNNINKLKDTIIQLLKLNYPHRF